MGRNHGRWFAHAMLENQRLRVLAVGGLVGVMGDTGNEFEGWYRRSHADVVSVLVGITGDAQVAAEAADEAFARALERWDRVSAMDSPTGWVHTTALNVARRRFRRRTLERALLVRSRPDPLPGPAGELWLIVEGLPLRQRAAVALRHVGQMTEPEIAEVMGITRGTVSATLRHAYESLRGRLDESDADRKEADDVAS